MQRLQYRNNILRTKHAVNVKINQMNCLFGVVTFSLFTLAHSDVASIETDIEDAPFIASIQARNTLNCTTCNDWDHVCSGVIVSEKNVITIASCCLIKDPHSSSMIMRKTKDMLVMVGSNRKDVGRRVPVRRYCYHKNYSFASTTYNIAVIVLQTALQFGYKVKVAKTPKVRLKDTSKELSRMVKEGQKCRVYGWNMIEDSSQDDRKALLMMIQLRLVDERNCSASYRNDQLNYSHQVCAHFKGRTLCDLGSPLVCEDKVWGLYVTSGGCPSDKPSIFSRMDSALAWSKEALSSSTRQVFNTYILLLWLMFFV